MGLFSKHKPPSVWKVGEKVCCLIEINKKSGKRSWFLGEVANIPYTKPNEESSIDVWVYEMPEHFSSTQKKNEKPLEEWSSLDPLPFLLPREIIIFSLLNSRSDITMKKSARTVRVECKYLCRATENDFRKAYITYHYFYA